MSGRITTVGKNRQTTVEAHEQQVSSESPSQSPAARGSYSTPASVQSPSQPLLHGSVIDMIDSNEDDSFIEPITSPSDLSTQQDKDPENNFGITSLCNRSFHTCDDAKQALKDWCAQSGLPNPWISKNSSHKGIWFKANCCSKRQGKRVDAEKVCCKWSAEIHQVGSGWKITDCDKPSEHSASCLQSGSKPFLSIEMVSDYPTETGKRDEWFIQFEKQHGWVPNRHTVTQLASRMKKVKAAQDLTMIALDDDWLEEVNAPNVNLKYQPEWMQFLDIPESVQTLTCSSECKHNNQWCQ